MMIQLSKLLRSNSGRV